MHWTSLEDVLATRLAELAELGLRRDGRAVRREPGARLRSGDRLLADFCSNDYLGLATDPRLAAAAAAAAAQYGTGAASARLISGTHTLHEQLERELAAWSGRAAGLLFSSGYAANTGAIPALAGEGDTIYSDQLNHASIIDGCRLSRARVRVFPHADLVTLADMLEADRAQPGARWIVVESVFSMDGDMFPIDRLAELASHFGAWVYVDDAHGVGLIGPGGRGGPACFGAERRVDVLVGTLGKAFGVAGAFVLAAEPVRDWLLNRSRPFVFSTASPPSLAAAALAALDLVRHDDAGRERLFANANRLRAGLTELGVSLPPNLAGHILPVRLGSPVETVVAARQLERLGFAVGCIRPPSVPEGGSRLRISVSAAHSTEQIDGLLDSLASVLPRSAGAASRPAAAQ